MSEPLIPTPEMIAAAWGVLRDRWPDRPHLLGSGPGFREAIEAAFAKMPTPTMAPIPQPLAMPEYPYQQHEIGGCLAVKKGGGDA